MHADPAYPLFSAPDTAPHWPSQCVVCRTWGWRNLCDGCVRRFASSACRCPRCAIATPRPEPCGQCLRHPPPFESTLAAVDYAYPWDRLISNFKFRNRPELGMALGGLMIANARRMVVQSDLMVPVPLGIQRLRERGYNQAWELARRCARALRCPAAPDLLLRVRESPHQLALPRELRIENVRGVFAIEPNKVPWLRNRRVTLVDDVMTTQATASEAARVLLAAGARSVQVWVIARTLADHQS